MLDTLHYRYREPDDGRKWRLKKKTFETNTFPRPMLKLYLITAHNKAYNHIQQKDIILLFQTYHVHWLSLPKAVFLPPYQPNIFILVFLKFIPQIHSIAQEELNFLKKKSSAKNMCIKPMSLLVSERQSWITTDTHDLIFFFLQNAQ